MTPPIERHSNDCATIIPAASGKHVSTPILLMSGPLVGGVLADFLGRDQCGGIQAKKNRDSGHVRLEGGTRH